MYPCADGVQASVPAKDRRQASAGPSRGIGALGAPGASRAPAPKPAFAVGASTEGPQPCEFAAARGSGKF